MRKIYSLSPDKGTRQFKWNCHKTNLQLCTQDICQVREKILLHQICQNIIFRKKNRENLIKSFQKRSACFGLIQDTRCSCIFFCVMSKIDIHAHTDTYEHIYTHLKPPPFLSLPSPSLAVLNKRVKSHIGQKKFLKVEAMSSKENRNSGKLNV